MHFSDYCYFRL